MKKNTKPNFWTQFRWFGAMQIVGLGVYFALLVVIGKMFTMGPAHMFLYLYLAFGMFMIGASFIRSVPTEKKYKAFANKRGYIEFMDLPPLGQARCADMLAMTGFFQVVLAASLYKWAQQGIYDLLLVTIIAAIGTYTFVRGFIILNQKLLLHAKTA